MKDISTLELGGSSTVVSGEALAGLASKLGGRIVTREDADYDKVRQIWNGLIDKRPAFIAQCSSTDDIVTCVKFARERKLLVAVRGGGHNVAGKGTCDDGMLIDLSPMKRVTIDAEARVATVQPGVLLGEMDTATQAVGMVVPAGVVTTTGVAGLTLGGGLGWLMRKWGLTCDNLLSAEVVMADGRVVRATAEENTDLFWALRGGGGNFGIVSEFTYRSYPLGKVYAGPMAFHPHRAKEIFQFVRKFKETAPEELAVSMMLRTIPLATLPLPLRIIRKLQGRDDGIRAAILIVVWCGDIEKGPEVIRPLRDLKPRKDMVGIKDFVEIQQQFDIASPKGWRYYMKSIFMKELSDEAIDTLVEKWETMPSHLSLMHLEGLGGAVGRVAKDATAFPHRDAAYNFYGMSIWRDPAEDEPNIAWTRDVFKQLEPHAMDGVYVNYMSDDEGSRVRSAYAGTNYDRLLEIKRKYDPDNFFRTNMNLSATPAAERPAPPPRPAPTDQSRA